jgi:hypothetical protein
VDLKKRSVADANFGGNEEYFSGQITIMIPTPYFLSMEEGRVRSPIFR